VTFYGFAHAFVGALFRVLFRYRVIGAEKIPRDGGLIIAANHISNFDPPILGVALPRPVSYMAKKVGIFPEGGRNVTGTNEEKAGAAFLAAASGAPVIPAAIVGTRRLRPFGKVTVVFGDPIHVVRNRQSGGDGLEKGAAEIMQRIRTLEESNR